MSEWTGLIHAIFRGEAEKHWRITEGLLEMGLGLLCCDFISFKSMLADTAARWSRASSLTSPLPWCLSKPPLSQHKCLFNCRVAGSGNWSHLKRTCQNQMVNFNPAQFPSLVHSAAAQMCIRAGGGQEDSASAVSAWAYAGQSPCEPTAERAQASASTALVCSVPAKWREFDWCCAVC